MHDARHDVAAQPVQEAEAHVADGDEIDVDPVASPLLEALRDQTQHVRVQAAAQSLVGRDDDHAHAFDGGALDEERVLVLGVGLRDVHRDVEDAFDVWARRAHPVLGLLHLRGRDHLHRLGVTRPAAIPDSPPSLHVEIGRKLVRACREQGVGIVRGEPVVGSRFLRFEVRLSPGARLDALRRRMPEVALRLALPQEPIVTAEAGLLLI